MPAHDPIVAITVKTASKSRAKCFAPRTKIRAVFAVDFRTEQSEIHMRRALSNPVTGRNLEPPTLRVVDVVLWIGLGLEVGLLLGLNLGCRRDASYDWNDKRFQIAGDSMVPALYGAHVRSRCPSCRIVLRTTTMGQASEITRRTCPNCRQEHHDADWQMESISGQTVGLRQIDGFNGERINRWAVVVLRDPEDSTRLVVKRVVGLPDELVEIRAGRIWIDGCIQEWPPHLRTPFVVNDDRLRGEEHRSHWHNSDENSQWQLSERGFSLKPSFETTLKPTQQVIALDRIHWLRFSQAASFPPTNKQTLLDEIPFNTHVSRSLNPVVDVAVSGVAEFHDAKHDLVGREFVGGDLAGRGSLHLQYELGDQRWQLDYDFSNQQLDWRSPTVSWTKPIASSLASPNPGEDSAARLEFRIHRFGTIVRFSINDRLAAEDDRLDLGWDKLAVARFAVGAAPTQQTLVKLHGLRVRRERFVTTDSPRPLPKTQWHLAQDEYFLLGDNSPVSIDSRHWGPVRGKQILAEVAELPPSENLLRRKN